MRKFRFIMDLPSHTRAKPARASVEVVEYTKKAAISRFQRMFGRVSKAERETGLSNVPQFVVEELR